MKFTLPILVALVATSVVSADEPVIETEEDKILYSVGVSLSSRLAIFALNENELAKVQAGIADGVLHRKRKTSLANYGPKIDEFLQERIRETGVRERRLGAAYLAEASKDPSGTRSDSGVIYFQVEEGIGDSIGPGESAVIHYKGSLPDGRVFYDSIDIEGGPITMSPSQGVPCFQEGLLKMRIGGKSRFVCPPETAFGEQGTQLVPAGATVIFEVELVNITQGG